MPELVIRYRLAISIHALRKESDLVETAPRGLLFVFQSTLSVRRATGFFQAC